MEDSEKDDLEKAFQKPVNKEGLVKVLQDTFRELEMEKMTDEGHRPGSGLECDLHTALVLGNLQFDVSAEVEEGDSSDRHRREPLELAAEPSRRPGDKAFVPVAPGNAVASRKRAKAAFAPDPAQVEYSSGPKLMHAFRHGRVTVLRNVASRMIYINSGGDGSLFSHGLGTRVHAATMPNRRV